ncbi:FtsL-like putative cell division protein [Ferruginibacter sp.]
MQGEKKITEPSLTQKIEWRRLLSYKWVVKNIPFFLFLSVLAVLYIYNGHYADKLVRKINVTEKHIKELEYEYKTVKSEVIFRSKASELAKAVEPLGLKELVAPPVVLTAPPILPQGEGNGGGK